MAFGIRLSRCSSNRWVNRYEQIRKSWFFPSKSTANSLCKAPCPISALRSSSLKSSGKCAASARTLKAYGGRDPLDGLALKKRFCQGGSRHPPYHTKRSGGNLCTRHPPSPAVGPLSPAVGPLSPAAHPRQQQARSVGHESGDLQDVGPRIASPGAAGSSALALISQLGSFRPGARLAQFPSRWLVRLKVHQVALPSSRNERQHSTCRAQGP